ncbi:MAG: VanZ family protein [Chloroflexi bacterium]|nr:VanZ family protein [Chloroflexota bacterium]
MAVGSKVRLLSGALALTWMGLIFYSSGQSTLAVDGVGPEQAELFVRKFGHAIVFGILAILLRGAAGFRGRGFLEGVAALAATAVYAASDEFHQSFTPGRSGNLTDVLIDTGGAAAALVFVATVRYQIVAAQLAAAFRHRLSRNG